MSTNCKEDLHIDTAKLLQTCQGQREALWCPLLGSLFVFRKLHTTKFMMGAGGEWYTMRSFSDTSETSYYQEALSPEQHQSLLRCLLQPSINRLKQQHVVISTYILRASDQI